MQKKTVLVTGSSRGIGKAVAMKFAENGYNVVINCLRSVDALEETRKEIECAGACCLAVSGDIGNYQFVEELFQKIHEVFGKIDVLVNNAGISYIGLLQDMTPEQWNQTIQTNLTSVFNCCSHAIPDMVSRQQGKIINISSVWGVVGASCEVAYSASKGGINGLTMALGKELAPSNIQVNAIACGAIDTEMNQFLEEDEMNALIEEIPTGRLGKPEEVAELAFSLAENHNYLTSQVIKLDGGWL